MKDLSVNELLWLAMEAKTSCPNCGGEIVINAKNIAMELGMTIKDSSGDVVSKTETSYIIDCPHCGKTHKIRFNAELIEKED